MVNIDKEEYDSDEDLDHSQKKDPLADDDVETAQSKRFFEHMNPKSYSWCLMRYAIVKYSLANINAFFNVIGIEPQDIAIQSPLIHQIMKSFEKWQEMLLFELNQLYESG